MNKKLLEVAKAVRENAYAPYSTYKVGCALLDENGKIHAGANVEICVNGASVCAERSAVSALVSSGAKKIREILVVTPSTPPGAPCGVCRQVLAEFADPSTVVHCANVEGEGLSTTLGNLLPAAFTPITIADSLRKASPKK